MRQPSCNNTAQRRAIPLVFAAMNDTSRAPSRPRPPTRAPEASSATTDARRAVDEHRQPLPNRLPIPRRSLPAERAARRQRSDAHVGAPVGARPPVWARGGDGAVDPTDDAREGRLPVVVARAGGYARAERGNDQGRPPQKRRRRPRQRRGCSAGEAAGATEAAAATPKGLFHACRRTKKEFSLLFQRLIDYEKLQKWSLWHGYSEKKKKALKVL